MIITNEAVQIVKENVHKIKSIEDYNSQNISIYTNCYAYALGATIEYPEVYRLGVFSGKKMDIEEPYSSEGEMKYLLESDLNALDVNFQKVEGNNEEQIKKEVSNMTLQDNQYIIVLLAFHYANGLLRDFHFIKYENKNGWTDKRWRVLPSKLYSWPIKLYYNVLGAYLITVKECIN